MDKTKPPERLMTERLLLRRMAPSDAPAVFEYASDSEVSRFLEWTTHTSLADAVAYTKEAYGWWDAGTEYCWAITRDDKVVGAIAIRLRGHMADIGFGLARDLWGKGFVTEAAQAVLDWAAAQKDFVRVWATCDVDNVASARVLEKIGMQREGVLRNWSIRPNLPGKPARDSFVYAWVRSQEAFEDERADQKS